MAIMVLLLVMLAAIPIDGGLALVLLRQTQNGADAAAQAAAAALSEPCFSLTSNVTTVTTMPTVVDHALALGIAGSDAATPAWHARYLDDTGALLTSGGSPYGDIAAVAPPARACGVTISVTAARRNSLAALMGFDSLKVTASSAAVLRWTGGVMALAKYGRHTFHAKGLGGLEIDGNLYMASHGCSWVAVDRGLAQPDANRALPDTTVIDSTGVHDTCAPGAGPAGRAIASAGPGLGPFARWGEDSIDSFDFSPGDETLIYNLLCVLGYLGTPCPPQVRVLNITGSVFSSTKWPFDPGFYDLGGPGQELTRTGMPFPPGAEDASRAPFENIYFDVAPGKVGSIATPDIRDPLADMPTPDLAHPEKYCPSAGVDPLPTVSGSTLHLKPGTYTRPFVVGGPNDSNHRHAGNVVFDGCGTYPGVYAFAEGVEICPEAGRAVTSTAAGVLLYSAGPFGGVGPQVQPQRGCPGEGKATPFYEPSPRFCPPGSPPAPPPFTGDVVCYENDDQVLDAGYYGTGTYGITIGGHGPVTLSAPAAGTWKGILLFQDRARDDLHTRGPAVAAGTATAESGANIGLDPYPGARSDRAGYLPDSIPAPGDGGYHDNRHQPASGFACGTCVKRVPSLAQLPDDSVITLNGTVYDAYAPLTGDSTSDATQQARFSCWRGGVVRQPDTNSGIAGATAGPASCYLADVGNTPADEDQPTPGASLQPAALYDEPANGSNPWPDCAQVAPGRQPLCQHQLQKADLWRVLCSVGTPAASAGRLQLGQSTCSNDYDEMSTYITKGVINITGAAIADTFTVTGGVAANIEVRSTTDATLIVAPPPP